MPVALLLVLSIPLSIGMGIVVLIMRYAAARRRSQLAAGPLLPRDPSEPAYPLRCPGCWLAIKSRSAFAVQSALGLHNPKPCSWLQGLAGEEKLFIAPAVRGWVLVMGSGLPEPSEDVDACFRFLLVLSRRLGQVQLFSASRVLQYHAWAKADSGRIVRAYAWAGKAIWNQGAVTYPEKELGLKCFEYLDTFEPEQFGQSDLLSQNVEKVALLASRWSIDPGRLDPRFLQMERGIAGEPSWRY